MLRHLIALISLSLGAAGVIAQEAAPAAPQTPAAEAASSSPTEAPSPDAAAASASGPPGVKTLSGMSILGNEEAPKSLVIVPWKSSEIGDGIGVDDAIDDRARPVDKDVFLRELRYYQLRSGEGGG
jgi:hypothetical protein